MQRPKMTRAEILQAACDRLNGHRQMNRANASAEKPADVHPAPSTALPTIIYKPADNPRSRLVAESAEGSYQEGIKGYKYLRRKYAAALLSGSTRLGTLHDYRREELGHGIADPNEGRKRLHHQATHFDVQGGTPEGDAFKHMGLNVASGASVKFEGVRLVREIDHPDVFVWCCASVLDAEITKELDGAETCVEIADLGGFFREITAALNKVRPVKFLGMQEIKYLPIDQPWNGIDLGLSAAFSKEPGAYGAQHEIRAIWAPLDDEPIEPFILQADGLSRFCKEVELPT